MHLLIPRGTKHPKKGNSIIGLLFFVVFPHTFYAGDGERGNWKGEELRGLPLKLDDKDRHSPSWVPLSSSTPGAKRAVGQCL